MHGVRVLHGLAVPLQHGGGGDVLGRGVAGGGLVPEGQLVDGVGGVELLQRHLARERGGAQGNGLSPTQGSQPE